MASASILFAATGLGSVARVKSPKLFVKSSVDTNVSDMSVNAPKGLFPPEPEHYRGPKLKVDIYESRPFIGGKVGSFVDRRGNHIEMGLHVFFGCYNNLFRLMKKFVLSTWSWVGADKNLLVRDHTHTFVNKGGEIGELDFRFPVGAPIHGIRAFLTTNQLKTYDKARNAVALALSPVVKALVDPDGAMSDIRDLDSVYNITLSFFCFSSLLNSHQATNKKIVKADAYVAACDVPGIKRLLPSQWRESQFFSNIYELVGVPVVIVQLRYNGWVTELQDLERSRCVLTPGDPYMPLLNDEIIKIVAKQVLTLFPLSQGLEVIWSSVVKIEQSLYREGPGKDPFRPDQKTPVKNFFLTGSYTKQDYIDSMEGATLSGRQASAYICDAGKELVALRKKLAAVGSQLETSSVPDELSLV
ncbi:hypothetical protein REPUB_Repub06bG0033700 [Reevesia pubescens]